MNGPRPAGVLARFLRLQNAPDEDVAAFCRSHGPLLVLESGQIGLCLAEFPPRVHVDDRWWHRKDPAHWQAMASAALDTFAVGRSLGGRRLVDLEPVRLK